MRTMNQYRLHCWYHNCDLFSPLSTDDHDTIFGVPPAFWIYKVGPFDLVEVLSLMVLSALYMDGTPKIVVPFPPNHPLKNRVFHYKSSIWGEKKPYFWSSTLSMEFFHVPYVFLKIGFFKGPLQAASGASGTSTWNPCGASRDSKKGGWKGCKNDGDGFGKGSRFAEFLAKKMENMSSSLLTS